MPLQFIHLAALVSSKYTTFNDRQKLPCHQDSAGSKSALNHHPENSHQKYKSHNLANFTTFAIHKLKEVRIQKYS